LGTWEELIEHYSRFGQPGEEPHVALSQTQVVLIAFGILLSGFMLAMATYVVTMKFAVDLRNPYLRTLLSALHQDDLKRTRRR
jgi:hypothetical protein